MKKEVKHVGSKLIKKLKANFNIIINVEIDTKIFENKFDNGKKILDCDLEYNRESIMKQADKQIIENLVENFKIPRKVFNVIGGRVGLSFLMGAKEKRMFDL